MALVEHVAIYLHSMRGGGIPRVMTNLANAFVERGVCVDFVLGKAEGPHLKTLSPDVHVVQFWKARALTTVPPLVRYLRRETPDVLFTGNTHLNILALVAHRLARVPTAVVISEHAEYFQQQASRRLRIPGIAWLIPKLMAWTYPWADRVVGVSDGVTSSLLEAFRLTPEKTCTIWNPVIGETLYKMAAEPNCHPWLDRTGAPVVLAVGRLTYQKNFPALLRAFANLRQSLDARLIILGEGEDRASIEKLIDELDLRQVVDMPGFVSNPYSFMRRASVFVLSSRWEGFGMVIVEAIASGAPVVSTDCPSGPREIIEQAGVGRLVPQENEVALAQATLDELRERPGTRREPNLEPFKLPFVADKYLGLFEQAVKERSSLRRKKG